MKVLITLDVIQGIPKWFHVINIKNADKYVLINIKKAFFYNGNNSKKLLEYT